MVQQLYEMPVSVNVGFSASVLIRDMIEVVRNIENLL
jgi:hypothetical protein